MEKKEAKNGMSKNVQKIEKLLIVICMIFIVLSSPALAVTAEENAEADEKRREEVELRNEADQLVFQVDKTLEDLERLKSVLINARKRR